MFLPTALFAALRPLFTFQLVQHAQVSLLKPRPFCQVFGSLGNTNKSATSLLFSSYLTLILSSPRCSLLHLSFHLKLSGRNCLLSSVLSGYIGSPNTHFFWGMMWVMNWPDGEHYLQPLQFLVVKRISLLIFCILFSFFGLEVYCLT